MVDRARPIGKYVLVRFVVPKLGPRDQRRKGLVLERSGELSKRLRSSADTGRPANLRADTGIGPTGILEDFPADSEAQLTAEIVDQIGAEPIPGGVGSWPDHTGVPFVPIVGLQDHGILVGDLRRDDNGPGRQLFLGWIDPRYY